MSTTPHGRPRFVYRTQGGTTTDMYMLPVGTTFSVANGAWDGKIVEEDGDRCIYVLATKRIIPLFPEEDYELVLRDVVLPQRQG